MSDLSSAQLLLGLLSGTLVGFSLGLIGGGGSILAVPLLLFVVGVPMPHVAIGTTAAAVAANAGANLVSHGRAGTVKWRCALVFSAFGVAGAAAGSSLGKAVDGERLLALFAVLMLVIAGTMVLRTPRFEVDDVRLGWANASKLAVIGFLAGGVSGFFGIGGGFLIVPGLMLATGMPILNAIASSLVAVTAFGLTTAINYAGDGLVDWMLAAALLLGGAAGGVIGARTARILGRQRGMLNIVFATVIAATALVMLARSAGALSG